MGGILLIVFGAGSLFGVLVSGGMKISNRQAFSGRYMPMPGVHRNISHDVTTLEGKKN